MEEFYDDESFLARWLNNELTPEEEEKFRASAAYHDYKRIVDTTDSFKTPYYNPLAELNALKSKLQSDERSEQPASKRWVWYSAAASIIIMFGLFYFLQDEQTVTTTLAGQSKVFALPDGSVVSLNFGSSISYSADGWTAEREVTLTGEAFFNVKKGEKFSVVTKDGSVDVLGTSFNVKSRFRLFMVSCYTGKVRVWTEYEETVLTPGMECTLLENKFINTTNNLETPLWLSGESRFDNTPILTVIEELEMIYDISIVDKRINANLKFTGWVPHNDLDAAAKIVFEPLNISFNKLQDNKYEVIERK